VQAVAVGGATGSVASGGRPAVGVAWSGNIASPASASGSGGGGTAEVGTRGPAGAAGVSGQTGGATTGGAMATAAGSSSTAAVGCAVAPISADMRKAYDNMNEPYYTKFASANGIIVATGAKVGDDAVTRYCQLLT
jgi:hypothetical protein